MQFVISLQQVLGALAVIITSLVTIGTLSYKIYKQLVPNSGSSLRDAVDNLNFKVDKINLIQMVFLDHGVENVAMFATDNKGRCEWVNKAYRELTGETMEDMLGNNWACCVHQDDRTAIEKEWEQTSHQSRNFDMTYRFVNKNGDSIPVHCQAWGDEKMGYFGIVRRIQDKYRK